MTDLCKRADALDLYLIYSSSLPCVLYIEFHIQNRSIMMSHYCPSLLQKVAIAARAIQMMQLGPKSTEEAAARP